MVAQNPVALAANTLRTLGDGGTQAISQLGNQLTRAASQLLGGVAGGPGVAQAGLPLPLGLPALPGIAPNGAAAGNGPLGLPSIQSLVPIQAVQALGQLENSVLPPGVPRISALLLGIAQPAAAPTPAAPEVEMGLRPATRIGAAVGVEGLNGASRTGREDVGVQLV